MTPLASVVTPVYRTPLSLFEEAFHSLLSQTCGFEKIEWLVAVHNMDDAYAAALREITGERDNIIFLRVEGGHSPSVPRNRCLDHASGKYVFFLDSDDRMASDCIEKAVKAMEASSAQIAVFHCALQSEPDATEFATDFELNAPDEELVVYERGDPRIISLMAEWGGMLWSRAYDRRLLLRSGVIFDEEVRTGEDLLYNLAVTPLAECVCALPGLTGYFHRQWTGSLIQSEYSRGNEAKQMLRYLPVIQESGATELLWYYLSWFVKKAMQSGREAALPSQLIEDLEPVLQGMRVMAPRFACTRDRIAGMLGLCSAVLSLSAAPRLRQRFEMLEMPLYEEEVLLRAAAAAAENVELRTVGTEGEQNPFLGISRSDARPQICMVDLQFMNLERQKAHMESYRRVELLRGFKEGTEVCCRVTVFRLSALRCALSLTWDDRFVGSQGIDRLWDRILGDMGKYAPNYRSVWEMIRHQTLMEPEKTVFRYWDGDGLASVSRLELSRQMDALGAALSLEGLCSGRIAIAARNCYAWVLLNLTALRLGLTVVALDPALSTEEMEWRLRRTDASAIFLGEDVPEPGMESVRRFRLCDLSELMKKGKNHLCPEEECPALADSKALIVFTSGTTGYRKAAVLTRGNLLSAARCSALCMEWYERFAFCVPLYHAGAHQDLIRGLYMGSEILITSTQLDIMLRDFHAFRLQSTNLVPRLLEMLRMLIRDMDPAEARSCLGGALKMLFCGSAPLPEPSARAFNDLGISISNLYGCTETVGPATHSPVRKPRRGAEVVPFSGIELRVDEDGELLFRSPTVFAGYLDDPEATAQVLDSDGWFHTGDLGRYDAEDGTVTVTGRLKNLILFSNGENVSPEELENQLAGCALVEECLVFGEEDERIAARIFPAAGGRRMEPGQLRQALWEYIAALNDTNPHYMRIDRFYVSSAPLERNHMGKLKRTPVSL